MTTSLPYTWASSTPGFTAQDIGSVLTASATGPTWTYTTDTIPTASLTQSAQLSLTGENADIKINGESLNETLKEIKEALLVPRGLLRNTELENEFDELKQLALDYEQRVKEFKEKKKVWDILKKE